MPITVARAPGGNQGPDIVDPLLVNDQVSRSRGRRECDYNGTNRMIAGCQCPKHSYMPTGSLVKVTEASEVWPGVTRYWSLTLTIDGEDETRFTADMRLDIEREMKK